METQTKQNNARTRLRHGGLTITATSHKTGHHITLRYRCKNRNLKQRHVNLAEAKIVTVDAGRVLNGSYEQRDMVGWCFADQISNPAKFRVHQHADPARAWLAKHLLAWLAGSELHDDLEVRLQDFCGRCSRPLADPESIDRGVGPECWGKTTGSRHQTRQRATA